MYVDDPETLADPRCLPMAHRRPVVHAAGHSHDRRVLLPSETRGRTYGAKLAASGVPTRTIRYNGLSHAFLDKIGVWPQAEACVDDIAEALAPDSA